MTKKNQKVVGKCLFSLRVHLMSVEYYSINVATFPEKKSGMEWGTNPIRSHSHENRPLAMCILEAHANVWSNILLDFNIHLLIFICKHG